MFAAKNIFLLIFSEKYKINFKNWLIRSECFSYLNTFLFFTYQIIIHTDENQGVVVLFFISDKNTLCRHIFF